MSLPLPGPLKVDCPDGCGLFGRPVKSRHGHIMGCKCQPCQNGRNSKGGKAVHRLFAKVAGIITGWGRSSDEESWRDHFRWEVKSGKQVDPIFTRFEAALAQSELQRPIGDPRPFAMGAVGSRRGSRYLVLLEAHIWKSVVVPGLKAALLAPIAYDLLQALLDVFDTLDLNYVEEATVEPLLSQVRAYLAGRPE